MFSPKSPRSPRHVSLEINAGDRWKADASSNHPPKSEDDEKLLGLQQTPIRRFRLFFPQVTFIETWPQAFVFVSYICLNLVYGAWVHRTQGIKYSATMMIASVLTTKMVASIVAYRIVDGPLSQLAQLLFVNRRALCQYAFPAFAYATTDSLTVYCLKKMDPTTFSVIYNIRVVFMLLLFQYFMRTTLRRNHWLAMLLVISGCIVKEGPYLFGASDAEKESSSRLTTCIVLVVMAQLAAFAAVYNEKLLKDQPLSLNVQNIAMYSWAIIATIFYSLVVPYFKQEGPIVQDVVDPGQWKIVWSYPIVVAVFLSAAYGLITSFFIKSLNNVVREIACAIQIVGTVPVNVLVFGYSLLPTDIIAIIAVLTGVTIYNHTPLNKT